MSFEDIKEEINSHVNEASHMINGLSQISSTERAERKQKIEKKFGDISSGIQELENSVMMLGANERNEAKSFLQSIKIETGRLQMDYTNMIKRLEERERLFGNATVSSLSNNQRGSVVDQRKQIDDGDSLVLELSRGSVNAKDSGVAILSELDNQRRKIDGVSNKLETLDEDIDQGEQILDIMICRNKRRAAFMWIIIFILVIACGIFLYFIFK